MGAESAPQVSVETSGKVTDTEGEHSSGGTTARRRRAPAGRETPRPVGDPLSPLLLPPREGQHVKSKATTGQEHRLKSPT